MKKNHILTIFSVFILSLVLAGCGKSGTGNYVLTDYGVDPNFKVVEMKTVDSESDYFTLRYDKNVWELQEWDAGTAPNRVALVNQGYENNKCALLPGTVGGGLDEGNQVIEGSLLTARYVGKTLDVFNPAGIQLMHIVGYEIDEEPYIFEVRLPAKDPAQCLSDSQAVISTFNVATPSRPAEATTESSEAEDSEANVGSVSVQVGGNQEE
ncbi:MAG: hypothetical protein ACD_28C00061G0002 [uncultured bacterium]|nr:MAG: hypothetical protein ACD_28C00061G0002 [uncultured bacterium]